MIDWYKRKLLARLTAAWPASKLHPVDVEEIDTRTWLVTFKHVETGEITLAPLHKADLRRQERLHRLASLGYPIDEQELLVPIPDAHAQESETEHCADLPTSPVVVNFSPDTAYYNIRPCNASFESVNEELDMGLQEELNQLKAMAQDLDEPVPTRWEFEGQTMKMRDKGGSQFKWIIENDLITLSLGRGKKTGLIGKVRLSSEYLQANCAGDLAEALVRVYGFLTLVYGEYIVLDVASLDLAADVLFLDLSALDIKEHFLSRAVLDEERPALLDEGYTDGPQVIRRRWKKLAGLTFGKHTSAVSVVIYNKTHEIKYASPEKKWFHDIWRRRAAALGIEYTEDMIVWRIEARFTRPAFREFPDVSDAFDVLDHLGDLWSYAVGHPGGGDDGLPDGWLRYVMPTDDTNRARWPVHPAWQVIQHAADPQPLPESDAEREQREWEEEKEELLQLVDEELAARPFKSSGPAPVFAVRKSKSVPAPAPDPAPLPEPVITPSMIKPFVRKRKREVNMERGIAQMVGWLSTIEAWRRGYAVDLDEETAVNDISATLSFVAEQADQYMLERAIDFTEVVYKKREIFFLQPSTAA